MPDYQVLVSRSLEPAHREVLNKVLGEYAGLTHLSDIPDTERASVLAGTDVIVSWSPAAEFSPEEMAMMSRPRLIQLLLAGADHVPFHAIPGHVLIASNAGAFAEPMAEHILGMILALAKKLCVNNTKLANGEFDQQTRTRTIQGMTLGVLGFGGIGQAAARLLRSAFGAGLMIINTSGQTTEPVEFAGTLIDLDFVLRSSDIVLITLPLTQKTRGLIGTRELELMRPDAILVNVARGAVIDEAALYERLVRCPEFSAAIDAWWIEPAVHGEFRINYPFFDLPNFLGSPHNSSVVPGIMRKIVKMAGENVVRFLKGEKIKGEVMPGEYAMD